MSGRNLVADEAVGMGHAVGRGPPYCMTLRLQHTKYNTTHETMIPFNYKVLRHNKNLTVYNVHTTWLGGGGRKT